MTDSQVILEIENLCARVDGVLILHNFSFKVHFGQIHAIMGPNGAGKSTLAKVLCGHPAYEITSGRVLFLGQDLLELDPDERSKLGLFMGFQYPIEIPGVSNTEFLKTAFNNACVYQGKPELDAQELQTRLEEKMELLHLHKSFATRNVNEGFSGGEKKRNEILQMALLEPKLALLDETDSGLDIDAMKVVADGVNTLMHPGMGLVLITHYQRLLDYITPDFVHVMKEGRIVKTGGKELALELEAHGYDVVEAPCNP